jgi:microcystin degradation protein MlrC
MAETKGWEVAEGLCATALPPGGRIVRSVYENLRTMVLNDLQQAMPVDGILLQMHGAALAHGYDDCEGDLLEHIRNITGSDIPIGVELDPHCHLSDKMVKHATAIILYKTFLHTDSKDRAVELFNVIADTLEGRVKPVMALFDCRMIDIFDDAYEPRKSFLESVYAREREPGILSISPVHGAALASIADMGSKMLVTTNNDPDLARKTAEELGMAFYEIRGQQSQYLDTDTALDRAQEKTGKGEKGIQLLEWSDLAGAGFPTDGTELLQAMFERGMTNAAVGLMWDPLVVSICHGAGPGAELMLRIGGKACRCSGMPMDLNVVVERVYKEAVIPTWLGDINLGDAVVVRSGETEIILVSKRALGYGPEAFRELGVEPDDKQYLLLKHFHDNDHINVWGTSFDLKKWPTTTGITRPKWPLDENPFENR